MVERAIDYDRGVTIREVSKTGVQVFMYKDSPGIYYNIVGQEVSEALAEEAGFPVAVHRKSRERKEKVAEAMAVIDAELATQGEVIQEKGGIQVVRATNETAWVVSGGQKLTPIPVPLETAAALLNKLVKDEAPKPTAKKKALEEADKA